MTSSLETWADEFYNALRSCVNRTGCMQAAGLSESGVFFPMTPKVVASKPKNILLAMEPSGSWAENNEDALRQIEAGKRCYWCHLGDFTLQFSIREALAEVFGSNYSNEYYITNMAKCAMNVKKAQGSQKLRWNYCTQVVKSELEHIYREYDASQMPTVFSIGNPPRDYLRNHPLHIKKSPAGLIEIEVKNTLMHCSKNWLAKRLQNYLLEDSSLARQCDRETSVRKKRLVAFIKDIAGPNAVGAEKVWVEMANDSILSIYARLSFIYKYVLVQSLQI